MVLFDFHFFPVCNIGKSINFGLGTVSGERVNTFGAAAPAVYNPFSKREIYLVDKTILASNHCREEVQRKKDFLLPLTLLLSLLLLLL